MSDTFTLLWGKILRSSLWVQESKETRLVWITLLALKDKDGLVQSSVVGLAHTAKVEMHECEAALLVLSSPDRNDTSKVDEGRRIREVKGGWQIINHDLYQFSTEEKREYWRQKKAAERARKPRRYQSAKPREFSNPPGTQLTESEKLQQSAAENGDTASEQRLHELRDKVPHGTYDNLYKLETAKDDETPF